MTYPDELKKGSVTPIFKLGGIDNVENYRSISILSTIAKILDKFIYNHINSKRWDDFQLEIQQQPTY